MSWRYIDPLLEKLSKHSTIITKYWVCLVVIFRLTILAFAERVWSDEQKEFKCNTKEVGCDNVCFNRFTPLSNVRLWGLQLLALCIPSALYLVYIWHLVSRAQHDQEDQKQKTRAMKALMDVRLKANKASAAAQNNGEANNNGTSKVDEKRGLENMANTNNSNNIISLSKNNQNTILENKITNPHPGIIHIGPPKNQTHIIPINYVSQHNTNTNNNKNNTNGATNNGPNGSYVHNWVKSIYTDEPNLNSNNNQNNKTIPQEILSEHQASSLNKSKATVELAAMNKRLKKYDQYDRFNKTILPNDWRAEAKKRPRNERNIWRCYLFQLISRTILDVVFVYLQWSIYPYKYTIPELYVCGDPYDDTITYPCRHQVDCFVSRPYEKTVFFIYFYVVAGMCFCLNIFEFYYIGFNRIRHAFSPVNQNKIEQAEKDKTSRLNRENEEKMKVNQAIPDLIQANIYNNPTAARNRKANSNKNLNNNAIMNPPDYTIGPAANVYIHDIGQQQKDGKSGKSSKSGKKVNDVHTPNNSYLLAMENAALSNASGNNLKIQTSTPKSQIQKTQPTCPTYSFQSPHQANDLNGNGSPNELLYKANNTYYGDMDYWLRLFCVLLIAYLKISHHTLKNAAFPYASFLANKDDIEAQDLAKNVKLASMYDAALRPEPAPGIGVAGITGISDRRDSSPPLRACRRELSHYAGGGQNHRYSRRPQLFRNNTQIQDSVDIENRSQQENDVYDQYENDYQDDGL